MDIILADEVEAKLWHYCRSVDTEIAAWGYVTDTEGGDLYVYDVFLVPQTVSGTEVDFVSDGLPYAVEKAMAEGKINDLRFCWHSHVNMGTGYSGTDEDMIRKVRDSGPIPWLVNVIFNKQGSTNGRIDVFKNSLDDSIKGLGHIQGIELDVVREANPTHLDGIDGEIKQHVRKKVQQQQYKGTNTVPKNKNSQTWQQAWADPAFAEPAALLPSGYDDDDIDWGDWDTPTDIDQMTKSQLEFEISQSETLVELGLHWDEISDDNGYSHWFDHEGQYKGMCMNDSTITKARELYAKKF